MIILTHSILNAPPEIEATASALGIGPIAYVPPKLYTHRIGDVRTFDQAKAERKLPEIEAICDDALWIFTDIEKEHRDRIRRTQNYSDRQVKESGDQYIECWSWFRTHWPDAKLFEWNLVNARESGVYEDGEQLILAHLDGFAVSLFYRDQAKWLRDREAIVAHAKSLVAGSGKIVIAGIQEQYKRHNADGTTTRTPIPREFVDAMVGTALDADGVMLWSKTYDTQFPPTGNELYLANARVVEMLAEMRLQNEEQSP